MAFALILIPLLVALYILNHFRERRGKRPVSERVIFPIGMLFVLGVIVYQLSVPLTEVIVIGGLGVLIGALTEWALRSE